MIKKKFIHSLLFCAIGDAIGYKNGSFEFNRNGNEIIGTVEDILGGICNVDLKDWKISDDTIMTIATAKGLISSGLNSEIETIMREIQTEYINCLNDLTYDRGPGITCLSKLRDLKKKRKKWSSSDQITMDFKGGGCGGSMRSSPIGLRFHGEENRESLVAIGIESGRLTHSHPTGFYGSLLSASFTAFAVEEIEPKFWGGKFMNEIVPIADYYLKYVEKPDNYRIVKDNSGKFMEHLNKFLIERDLFDMTEEKEVKYDEDFLNDVDKRYYYYQENYAHNKLMGWPGASGDDSCIIAYDSILMADGDYEKAIFYSALHGGDSDSTGAICMSWFGAYYGDVKGNEYLYKKNLENLEKKEELQNLGENLFKLVWL